MAVSKGRNAGRASKPRKKPAKKRYTTRIERALVKKIASDKRRDRAK